MVGSLPVPPLCNERGSIVFENKTRSLRACDGVYARRLTVEPILTLADVSTVDMLSETTPMSISSVHPTSLMNLFPD